MKCSKAHAAGSAPCFKYAGLQGKVPGKFRYRVEVARSAPVLRKTGPKLLGQADFYCQLF
jgi:hypothetical protein